ncbi:hypothetical protein BN1723_002211 [Verticillium longisporum]|uniref:Major facilitator superfamily (MFS) profile domain-containing protein n=1 Tax=Verticillium longisporum TaxID=100787 RepID=A0A0G4L209_VERLO|nr:hypothetical protein BN1723_002211 [Verticillium longisporum]
MASPPARKWYHIRWYSDTDTKEERKFIRKIDALIVPYAVLAYWVKYIDQSNLNNAYVAGLKEDLDFHGNELVQLQTFYIIGAVTGQIPFFFLVTYIPMHWLIPFLDISWGIFTLLQYRVQGFSELAAYRFLVGFFEAAFFPLIHYVLGAWYRGDEIARRGGIFYTGLSLGTLTAGLIQAGASARLDGVNGLEGWRWMYIICAVITIPVGILGYFVIPGTPDQPNRRVLTEQDIKIGESRLQRAGHAFHGKLKLQDLKKIFLKPQFWAIILIDRAAIGGLGPVSVGSPKKVADEMEHWIREGDLDGFNIGYVTTPGTFEDVVDLLVPELRRRGLYTEAPAADEQLTARERVYGRGQKGLRDDHPGSRYKYDVFEEDGPPA